MSEPIESAGWISIEQAALLKFSLRGIDVRKFCDVLGLASIDQLQREDTNRAVLLIELINEGIRK